MSRWTDFAGRILEGRGSLPLVIGVAALARLVGLGHHPLWYDEAFSVLIARKGPEAMLRGTLALSGSSAADVHPVLYYVLLWRWMEAFGESVIGLRLLSALLGLVTVALVWILARDLMGSRIGTVSALLIALSPFQVHYSQEVRMYALLAAFLLGATLALWRGTWKGGWPWWVCLSVCTALAMYTHILAVVFLVPLYLTPLLWKKQRALRNAAFSGLGSILLFLPWLIQVPSQVAKVASGYWVPRPGVQDLVTTLLVFVNELPVPSAVLPVSLFIAILMLLLAVFQTARVRKAGSAQAHWGFWFGYLSTAPVLLAFLLSQWHSVFVQRAFITSGVFFVVWVCWALSSPSVPRLVRTLGLGIFLLAQLAGLYYRYAYDGFPYAPFPTLVSNLKSVLRPGDVVLHSNKITMLPSVYYGPDLPQSYLRDVPGSASDTLAPETQRVLGLVASDSPGEAVGNAQRVDFIVFQQELDEYEAQTGSPDPNLAWLSARFILRTKIQLGDLWLYEFSR
ncbi:MAG: glycosyltransferase family 39 protein [Anaerolineales bacterium]